jgi:N-terminal half of MaoC dehydratase
MGSGREPSGLSQRSVVALHAEQSFEYHKVIRPGMVLSAMRHDGASWEKVGRRGGRMHFQEIITEYRDDSGELVVTARTLGVTPERAVERGA